MPITGAVSALLWGLAAGSALLIGAAFGWFLNFSRRAVAWIMAFGSGILISAIAFELMSKAFRTGGFAMTSIGFLAGAGIFTAASLLLSRRGGRHRKRSVQHHIDRNATAIAIGTAIDTIPESIVIGLSFVNGTGVALATIAAVFLSNVPEALSSSAGMKSAGHGPAYVFAVWGGVMLAGGLLSLTGYLGLSAISAGWLAMVMALGAGALLAMIADTMIPEAFAETHDAAGFITALGFLTGFALSHALA